MPSCCCCSGRRLREEQGHRQAAPSRNRASRTKQNAAHRFAMSFTACQQRSAISHHWPCVCVPRYQNLSSVHLVLGSSTPHGQPVLIRSLGGRSCGLPASLCVNVGRSCFEFQLSGSYCSTTWARKRLNARWFGGFQGNNSRVSVAKLKGRNLPRTLGVAFMELIPLFGRFYRETKGTTSHFLAPQTRHT